MILIIAVVDLILLYIYIFTFLRRLFTWEICKWRATRVCVRDVRICVRIWMSLRWIVRTTDKHSLTNQKVNDPPAKVCISERVIFMAMPKSASISFNTFFWLRVFSWQYFMRENKKETFLFFMSSFPHDKVFRLFTLFERQ